MRRITIEDAIITFAVSCEGEIVSTRALRRENYMARNIRIRGEEAKEMAMIEFKEMEFLSMMMIRCPELMEALSEAYRINHCKIYLTVTG
ncbi:hypothetical protein Tco_0471321 [Tanacetum coccineum]